MPAAILLAMAVTLIVAAPKRIQAEEDNTYSSYSESEEEALSGEGEEVDIVVLDEGRETIKDWLNNFKQAKKEKRLPGAAIGDWSRHIAGENSGKAMETPVTGVQHVSLKVYFLYGIKVNDFFTHLYHE